MSPKSELHLRLSPSEMDFLIRYAKENGDLSLNGAVKNIISRIRRTISGTTLGIPTSNSDVLQ